LRRRRPHRVARRAGAERCSSDALTGPRAGRAGRPKSCRQRLTNRRTRRDRLRHHRFGVRDVEALASTDDPWTAYVQWLRDIVAADTHALTAHLAGLFTPDERHAARTERMIRGTIELFERVKQAGALRPGMTFLDVAFLLELLARHDWAMTIGRPSSSSANWPLSSTASAPTEPPASPAHHRRGRNRRAAGTRPEIPRSRRGLPSARPSRSSDATVAGICRRAATSSQWNRRRSGRPRRCPAPG
jgi:hypothetical protein